MKFSALALGFFAALSVAAPAPQDVAPPASELYIDKFTYGGTGCRYTPVVKIDDKTVAVIFDPYEARIGPRYPPPAPHVNCNINFRINYPQGYQYTLYKIDYYLSIVVLDQDVIATQKSSYWFSSFPFPRPTFKSTFRGKYDGPYSFTDTLATEAWAWSPCSANTTLNINTYLDLNNDFNKKGNGTITTPVLDTLYPKSSQTYGIHWRKC